jgi:hypothetical protein
MNSRCSDSISHKHYLKVSLENALEIKVAVEEDKNNTSTYFLVCVF